MHCNNCGHNSHCGNRYTVEDEDGYTGESYDAAALIVLAMQAGNSADRTSIAKNIMK